ncbi:MAG TPA: carbohydrate-binding protein, partial [Bacteroidales bacterium]|nr:carbohydrate-binding protein [Bacteroidales bacterium]HRT90822.1 carbohydrate-binding protein [Bacteroidales bacterium]
TFKGWKTLLSGQNAWVQYNSVDFGSKKLKTVQVNASSPAGGIVQIRLDKPDGLLVAEVKIPAGSDLKMTEARLSKYQKGVHHLVAVLKGSNAVEIDWVKFK